MFGKIKGKLSGIFKKQQETIEEEGVVEEKELGEEEQNENLEEKHTQEDLPVLPTEEEPKKKGFFGSIFSKKEDHEEADEETLEEVEEVMIEDVSEEEKKAIKEKKTLSKKTVEKNKKDLEEKEFKEEKLEKQTTKEIPIQKDKKEVEEALEESKIEKDLPLPPREVEVNDLGDKEVEEEEPEEKKGFFAKAFSGLKKKKITQDDYDKIWLDLEIFLLEINVAFEIVEKINKKLEESLVEHSFDRFGLTKTIRDVMVNEVEDVLKAREGNFLADLKSHVSSDGPVKIMMLGVNGTGKTTSIGKIIKYLQTQNLSVVVAASDTFRAAAVAQIEEHCKNLGVRCITHEDGSDPAAVAFDAIDHAKAKNIDVVLIDTAGRMPNNSNLMMELQKIKRVSTADMALFIGDSISGNDLIDQIDLFNKGIEISGVVLTKVDTDERPGSVVTCAYSIDKPIYFLGIGQGYDDLVQFNAKEVAEKLFDIEE